MWRLFRPARTIFPSSRVASHIHKGQTVALHRVRFSRPRVRLRNILVSGAVVFGCYALYSSVVISPLIKWVDDHEDELSAEERKEMDELEPLFVAFPFTIKAVQPLPYAGTDPEWTEFVKLSKDDKLQRRIRFSLAHIVRSVAQNSAMLTAKCGKDMKVKKFWIDMDFPYRPPTEYERSGLLVTDDTIEWATRSVDSSTVFRTNRILWPSPLFLSTWAFAGTLLKQNVLDVARMFGYEPKTPTIFPPAQNPPGTPVNPANPPPLPPSHHPEIQKAIQRIRQQATPRPEEVKDPRAMATQSRQIPDANPSAVPSAGPADAEGKGGESGKRTAPEELFPGHDTIRSLTSKPWREFRQKLSQTYKPRREQPPRGAVLVSGLVELDTSKASIVIDVFAWYNPKTRRFDGKSMWMGLRKVQMKTQSPLRR